MDDHLDRAAALLAKADMLIARSRVRDVSVDMFIRLACAHIELAKARTATAPGGGSKL